MSPLVRPATADDLPAIADLAARTFHLACPPGISAEAVTAHIATELTPQRFREHMASGELYVVDGEEGVVGYTMLMFEDPPIETDWQRPLEVRRIYVDEQAHGSGIADALMASAVERARAGGHDRIWLGTNEENVRALRFYRKWNFEVVGRRTFCVADSVERDFVLARTVG